MTRPVHLFPHAALLLLAWGAFAFGAEFTWAYAPLLVFSIAVSALALLAGANRSPSALREYRGLILALVLLFGAAVTQVIPLPPQVVSTLSPARDDADYAKLYTQWSLGEVDDSAPRLVARTLSIEPSRSVLGLAFLGAFSLLLVSSARAFGAVRATSLARGIIGLGVIGAFVSIIQKASGSLEIYGLFTPRQIGNAAAPLINPNHTAGWLAMAMALGLGYLASCVARGMKNVKPDWRGRLIWLSSADAAETILTAFSVSIMAVAIIFTGSRSGALCLVLAVVLFAWWGTTRQASRTRKTVTWLNVVFVLVAAAAVGGADAVVREFASVSLAEPDSRFSIWSVAISIVRDFALTGTGLNTYGVAALHYQQVKQPYLYIEAHNEYLQVAAEGGLLLGIPALVVLAIVAREVRRRFAAGEDDTRIYWLRAGAVIGLSVIAFQSLFDFTLQMPGAAALFVMLTGLAMHRK